jgi:hypothetical protein
VIGDLRLKPFVGLEDVAHVDDHDAARTYDRLTADRLLLRCKLRRGQCGQDSTCDNASQQTGGFHGQHSLLFGDFDVSVRATSMWCARGPREIA